MCAAAFPPCNQALRVSAPSELSLGIASTDPALACSVTCECRIRSA